MLDLSILDAKLEPIQLADGSIHQPYPLDMGGYRLLEIANKNPDDGAIFKKLIQRIVPSLTDDQYDTLTPVTLGLILGHARGILDSVIAELKKEQALQQKT